ncbi:FKBP-type peptidyl-prolyl cis-trans isomerase [Bifidobacterium sp. ESL0763]|uniref:FKBP-type peptidyl-prolyl cis-trans isomerase n=1 Tax=Bifidobacterium sp. ESL0763 TaxID=2983227 RepID=UPI0023F938E0|nr:FKBP-type peptidyl-prolyl cis-trans isomerase [Bifidobacterium sp. ESL0763]MDF7663324.1 FKBP-type peptidyl-prolyl cis-trans isomerase [Bifidobacterium sp. ESL0763]
MHNLKTGSPLKSLARACAALCALALSVGLAACGSSNDSSASSDDTQMAGVTASGQLGKKPKISFHTPMQVVNNSYAVLQKGDGATIGDGDRVCTQGVSLNAKDGSEMMSTWEKGTPDCSIVINKKSLNSMYYNLLKGQKINTTVAFGVNDGNKSSTSYIMALTLVSKSKADMRAKGEKVADVPADLPKVTLASNGAPSIDFNGYQPGGSLVAQTLIRGNGKKVTANDTVDVHYTGWVMGKDGKPSQFDSSWSKGAPVQLSLQQVVKGWTQGLAGQTVGSQVLLVIPPDLGYGDKAQDKIPANSTLYFVVDLLYDYGPQQSE